MIDHIFAEYNEREREKLYKIYMSDVVRSIAESVGVNVPLRYAELLRTAEKETDKKTGDEIALEVITKLGLKGRNYECDGHQSETDA